MRQRMTSSRRQAAGLTLIEVLVALVIISSGLLGVAGLHVSTLRSNYDALMISHASALADDIADRMRANRVAVKKDGVYDQIDLGKAPTVGTDPSQALLDAKEWKDALKAQLPDGDGNIVVDNIGVVTIFVQWGERGATLVFQTQTMI